MSSSVEHRLARLERPFDQVQDELDGLSRDAALAAEDWEDARAVAEALYTLNTVKRRISDVYAAYEQAVWPNFDQPITLANGATLEAKEGTPRTKWNHKAVTLAVAQRIVDLATDFDTGEVLMTKEEMVRELTKYAGIGYWKVTQLKKVGLNPDDFSTPGEGKKSIAISRPKE